MEILPGGITAEIPQGVFPLSTDTMVLADFVRLRAGAKVLDLGSGSGILGLLLVSASQSCTVTGIEISEEAHRAAQENIRRNSLADRLCSICGDLRDMKSRFDPGSFDCCVSNPPYFSGGEASSALPLARREDCCTPDDLFAAADHALKYGGDFFLVHRPERLAELCAVAEHHHLTPKQLRLVRHRDGGPVSLIVLGCRKGGKHGLTIDELSLHRADNTPTAEFCRIYHKEQ